MLDDEFEVATTPRCEIDETRWQTCIDFIWMQETYTTIVWIQDDEIDEIDDDIAERERLDDTHQVDEIDETVRIDDKYLFHTIVCMNNDVSMFRDENDESDDE